MRNAFRGYFTLSEKELTELWSSSDIVLDTNSLLNLYRFSEDLSSEFLGVLSALGNQLWIPHHVALEFHRRRVEVISSQSKAFDDVLSSVDSAVKQIADVANRFRRHPVLQAEKLRADAESYLLPLRTDIERAKTEHSDALAARAVNDDLLESVAVLFDGRVGAALSDGDLKGIYSEGAVRFDAKIPPGYLDKAKAEPDRYGDLVIWKQMMERAKSEARPMIFVTDDAKEDWWQVVGGRTIGARPELRQEFWEQTGQVVHFYSSDRFLKFAKEKLGAKVSDESIAEIDELTELDARSAPIPAQGEFIWDESFLQSAGANSSPSEDVTAQLYNALNLLNAQLDFMDPTSAAFAEKQAERDVLAKGIADILVFRRKLRQTKSPLLPTPSAHNLTNLESILTLLRKAGQPGAD